MIRFIFCFVADGVSIDRETNLVSAFSLRESVKAESFPVTIPKLDFCFLLEREKTDPEKFRGCFSIHLSGEDLVRQDIDIDFLGFRRHRMLLHVDRLAVPKSGQIVFRFDLPGHASADYRFEAEPASDAAMPVDAIAKRGTPTLLTTTTGEVRIR